LFFDDFDREFDRLFVVLLPFELVDRVFLVFEPDFFVPDERDLVWVVFFFVVEAIHPPLSSFHSNSFLPGNKMELSRLPWSFIAQNA